MHTLSRLRPLGNLFLVLGLLSSAPLHAAPEIWYDADGNIVKVGNRFLTEKEAFNMALQLKAQQQAQQAAQTQPSSTTTQPAQALPLNTPPVAPSQTSLNTANVGLYYQAPVTLSNTNYRPYYTNRPATYYYHYSPSLYRNPCNYHHHNYRPRTLRTNTGWTGFYQNNRGRSHWGFGYQGNGTSIRITR